LPSLPKANPSARDDEMKRFAVPKNGIFLNRHPKGNQITARELFSVL
jgi:hypothetical protein